MQNAEPGVKNESLTAFSCNQRDEVRDLHDVSAAVCASQTMKQQTFIAEGAACLNPWDTQQSRVFTEEGSSPTLAGADGGGGRNPAGLVFCSTLGRHTRDISEKPASTLTCQHEQPFICEQEIANTLTSADSNGVRNPAGIVFCSASSQSNAGITEELAGTLTCQHEQPFICEPELARALMASGDASPCADRGQNVVAVSVHQNGNGKLSVSETAKSLTTIGTASCRNAPLVCEASGVTSKGNGDCFLTPECHGALSQGGGQAGQGYPAVLCAATAQANAEIGEDICPTITEAAGASGNNKPYIVHPEVSGTLCASGAGLSRPAGMASEPDLCVAYALAGNMIGRQERNGPNGSGVKENLSFTLTATDTPAVASAIPIQDKATRCRGGGPTRGGDGAGNGLGIGKAGDPAPTLTSGDHHSVAAVFNRQRSDCFKEQDIASTQTARRCRDATDIVCSGIDEARNETCFTQSSYGALKEGVGLLRANGGDNGGGSENLIVSGDIPRYIVRRLTPTECERLQGFPDGWTRFGHDGKEISDTRRYQMLGNSVAVPCVKFIMAGIAGQLSRQREEAA